MKAYLGKDRAESLGRYYTVGQRTEVGKSLMRAGYGTVQTRKDELEYGLENGTIAPLLSRLAGSVIPADTQTSLDHLRLANGSWTYGHEDNTQFKSAQLNFTSVDQNLGELKRFGCLHMDPTDDEAGYNDNRSLQSSVRSLSWTFRLSRLTAILGCWAL